MKRTTNISKSCSNRNCGTRADTNGYEVRRRVGVWKIKKRGWLDTNATVSPLPTTTYSRSRYLWPALRDGRSGPKYITRRRFRFRRFVASPRYTQTLSAFSSACPGGGASSDQSVLPESFQIIKYAYGDDLRFSNSLSPSLPPSKSSIGRVVFGTFGNKMKNRKN